MNKILRLTMMLLLMVPVVSLHAKPVGKHTNVDCSKKTLQSAIDELDKSIANTLTISRHCTEDVVVHGFVNLTLIGTGGASLTAATFIPGEPGNSANALLIEHSKVTVQTLTINGGEWGVTCLRSTCDYRDATIQGGTNGLRYQDYSEGAILGSTVIQDSLRIGLGVYGASSVNIRVKDTFPPVAGPGPVISGHAAVGAAVLDGSYLRSNNATFSGNGWGIWAHRNAVIKIYGADDGGVINNLYDGIYVDHSSTAVVGLPVTENGGAGVWVGPLSSFHDEGTTFSGNNEGGADVVCVHPTAISQPHSWCGN